MTNLNDLTDEEFRDEVSERLFDKKNFGALLADDVADRARAVLTDMIVSLDQQLTAHTDDPDLGRAQWRRRAQGYRLQVIRQLVKVKAAIRDRNRLETATLAAVEKKWASFAFTVADALAESNMAHVLDDLKVGEIEAWDWLELRAKQQAAKVTA